MGKKILFRRNTLANMGDLDEGSPFWAKDKKVLFVGDSTGAKGTPIGWTGTNVYDQTSFDAIASIATATQITIAPGAYSVSADIIFPVEASLYVPNGVLITIDTGITLTINGAFEAGLYQVFNCVGTGKVVFGSGSVKAVYPEWWGAVGGATSSSSTDDYIALQAALTTGKPTFLNQNYAHTVGLAATASIIAYTRKFLYYDGVATALTVSSHGTQLVNVASVVYDDAADGIEIIDGARAIDFENVYILSHHNRATNTGKGLKITPVAAWIGQISINNLTVIGFKYGIYVESTDVSNTFTLLCGKNIILVGRSAGLVAGSVGIYFNDHTVGTGSWISGGIIEMYATGILIETGTVAGEGHGLSYTGDFEGNTTDWTVGTTFSGRIYDDNNGRLFEQGCNGVTNRWFQNKHLNGQIIKESYYDQKHVLTDVGDNIRQFSAYRGNSLIEGGVPELMGGFFADGAYTTYPTPERLHLMVGEQRMAWSAAAPTAGTWRIGDVIWNNAPASGGAGVNGWRCLTSGTFNTAATTGGIGTGTKVLTVADATGFSVGQYITIVGVTGIKQIMAIAGLVFTIDVNADATVVGAAVATPDPTFASMGVLP
jgi:hypothetical protein